MSDGLAGSCALEDTIFELPGDQPRPASSPDHVLSAENLERCALDQQVADWLKALDGDEAPTVEVWTMRVMARLGRHENALSHLSQIVRHLLQTTAQQNAIVSLTKRVEALERREGRSGE
jgi:hypothetical protein